MVGKRDGYKAYNSKTQADEESKRFSQNRKYNLSSLNSPNLCKFAMCSATSKCGHSKMDVPYKGKAMLTQMLQSYLNLWLL